MIELQELQVQVAGELRVLQVKVMGELQELQVSTERCRQAAD